MKKKSFIVGIFLALVFAGGLVIYYKNYPSTEIRQKISVEGMFLD
ncbi:hypothetical protein [Prochlorococcus marinus]|nr:hypothetical protein [Prochlorococcus marinus]